MSDHNIDVACICETFLKPDQHITQHPDYIVHRFDRSIETRGGGVMIIVKKTIQHVMLPSLNTKILETLGIQIKCRNSVLDVYSVYLPGGASTNDINRFYLNDIRKITNNRNCFFAPGDYNSKHRHWGCTRSNVAGRILYNEFCNNNFLILHPFEPTHVPADPRKSPSMIDIVLTNGLYAASELENFKLNSDHDPVYFEIKITDELIKNDVLYHRSYKNADWDRFRLLISQNLSTANLLIDNIVSTGQIDSMIENLTEVVIKAQDRSVPLSRNDKYSIELTPDIQEDMKIRNMFVRQWQRTRDTGIKRLVNLLNRSITLRIDELRNMNWNHMLSQIPNANRQLWQTTKFLKNKAKTIPPLKTSDRIHVTPIEKANVLADSFASFNVNPLQMDGPSFTSYIESQAESILQSTIDLNEINYSTPAELKLAIKHLKNRKAPGIDTISNLLIKQLPSSALIFINFIFMACMKLCYFPDDWKIAKVIALHKPGKDPSNPSSYRPISLLSSVSKLFERILLTRINCHVDENEILPPEQHGSRAKHSTTHQLNKTKNEINSSYRHDKSSTGMILMDVEKAYDRVWHAALIYKLKKYNFPLYIIKIIGSFLKNRKFFVRVQNESSSSKEITCGVPQGACLSPFLYTLFTADFPKYAGCSLALFVDDTCFYSSSPLVKIILENLTKYSAIIHKYMKRWKININKDKTQAIYFTHRRILELPPPTIRIFESDVKWETEVKYLGIFFDKKRLFKAHIDYVISKVNKLVKILYPIINRKSKLSTDNKLLLYKAVFRPIMTYGCPVFHDIAKIHLNKLQVMQNKILKIILDKPWYTSTDYIHNISKVPRLQEFIQKINDKFQRH